MTLHGIDLDSPPIHAFCQKWMIRELSVFGSILCNDFGAESDIDFLADFHPNEDWDLSDIQDMCEELETIVGHPVDLVEKAVLEQHDNPILRNEIFATAELACAA